MQKLDLHGKADLWGMASRIKMALAALLVLYVVAPCAAQGPVEREAFVSTTMILTDHELFVQVFTGSAVYGKPVLWVRIPQAVEGIGPQQTVEREGRNGLVIMAHDGYGPMQEAPRLLEFFGMEEKDGAITAYFSTRNRVDAPSDRPILKGRVRMPVFDGMGPAQVDFLDRIPKERKLRRKEGKGR